MTPQPWLEAAEHILHREQRRPCGQCPDLVPHTISLPRQHDQDCIELCDGVDCDRWHSCWCAGTGDFMDFPHP